jgi:4-hydroxyphenylpyruvate dioxygenase
MARPDDWGGAMSVDHHEPDLALDAEWDALTPASLFLGWDPLEWWVGNARQAAGFMAGCFGFAITGYAGPETGRTDGTCSYLLEQGDVRFVLTGALGPHSPVATSVRAHGDGVRDIAITVVDARAAYEAALERGGAGLAAPWVTEDDDGVLVRATVAAYGDTQHTFVERTGYHGLFVPGFSAETLPPAMVGAPVGLTRIDHVVANVEQGALSSWVGFYRRVLGMEQLVHFDDEQISTEYSALMSTVVWDGSKIVLPINEPADGRRQSQL